MSGWEKLGWSSEGFTPTWQYLVAVIILLVALIVLLSFA